MDVLAVDIRPRLNEKFHRCRVSESYCPGEWGTFERVLYAEVHVQLEQLAHTVVVRAIHRPVEGRLWGGGGTARPWVIDEASEAAGAEQCASECPYRQFVVLLPTHLPLVVLDVHVRALAHKKGDARCPVVDHCPN